MKHSTKRWLGAGGVSWCLAAVLGLTGCVGGGIDTAIDGGRPAYVIWGVVQSPAGLPASGAEVRLYPSGYDPTSSGDWEARAVVSDSVGRFIFTEGGGSGLFATAAARTAYYALVARSVDGSFWTMADSLRPHVWTRTDTLRISAPRRLEVGLTVADSVHGIRFPGVLFVPGTGMALPLDGTGAPALDTLPVGAKRVVLRFGQNEFVVDIPAGPDTLRIGSTPHGPGILP